MSVVREVQERHDHLIPVACHELVEDGHGNQGVSLPVVPQQVFFTERHQQGQGQENQDVIHPHILPKSKPAPRADDLGLVLEPLDIFICLI